MRRNDFFKTLAGIVVAPIALAKVLAKPSYEEKMWALDSVEGMTVNYPLTPEEMFPKQIMLDLSSWTDNRKSFYEIHGRFPVGDEGLPKDGLFCFLDEERKSKQCECVQCEFERKHGHWSKWEPKVGDVVALKSVKEEQFVLTRKIMGRRFMAKPLSDKIYFGDAYIAPLGIKWVKLN